MKRRAFLSATVSSGVVVTAGCLADDDSTYATIQRFHLLNTLANSAVLELRIEQSETGDRILDDHYELPSGDGGFDGITLECVWPDKPLEIATRRESDDSWNTLATTDYDKCMLLAAEINQRGTSYFASHEECPARNPDCHPNVGQ